MQPIRHPRITDEREGNIRALLRPDETLVLLSPVVIPRAFLIFLGIWGTLLALSALALISAVMPLATGNEIRISSVAGQSIVTVVLLGVFLYCVMMWKRLARITVALTDRHLMIVSDREAGWVGLDAIWRFTVFERPDRSGCIGIESDSWLAFRSMLGGAGPMLKLGPFADVMDADRLVRRAALPHERAIHAGADHSFPQETVPAPLQRRLMAFLDEDEALLDIERPVVPGVPRVLAQGTLNLLKHVATYFVLFFVAVVFYIHIFEREIPVEGRIAWVLGFAMVLAGCVGAARARNGVWKRTLYVLTNKRIITVRTFPNGSLTVTSYLADRTGILEVRKRGGKGGDLIFLKHVNGSSTRCEGMLRLEDLLGTKRCVDAILEAYSSSSPARHGRED